MHATQLKPRPAPQKAPQPRVRSIVDWSSCALVEVIPGKVSGVPLVKGTRVQADAIVGNYEYGSPVAEISENFTIPEETITALLKFAGKL